MVVGAVRLVIALDLLLRVIIIDSIYDCDICNKYLKWYIL